MRVFLRFRDHQYIPPVTVGAGPSLAPYPLPRSAFCFPKVFPSDRGNSNARRRRTVRHDVTGLSACAHPLPFKAPRVPSEPETELAQRYRDHAFLGVGPVHNQALPDDATRPGCLRSMLSYHLHPCASGGISSGGLRVASPLKSQSTAPQSIGPGRQWWTCLPRQLLR